MLISDRPKVYLCIALFCLLIILAATSKYFYQNRTQVTQEASPSGIDNSKSPSAWSTLIGPRLRFAREVNTLNIPPTEENVGQSFAKLPLSFEINKGQIDRRVKFFSRSNSSALFLTQSEALLAFRKPGAIELLKVPWIQLKIVATFSPHAIETLRT